MPTKTKVILHTKSMANRMYKIAADKQTERLVAYAEEEIVRMVDSKELGDDTFNLRDSYVWAVYYNGKKVKHGFYGNKLAKSKSILHAYSPLNSVDVNGRALARQFVQAYKPSETQGWEIVFAACAPYGAYWEGGHVNPPRSGRIRYAKVMMQRWDAITRTLTPKAKVILRINPPS